MIGAITNLVMQRGEPRYDMVGKRLPDPLHDSGEQISSGLIKRLYRYALGRMEDYGFEVADWVCEIYTMDGDKRPPDRFYCVEFTNTKGGMIGVQGIITNYGHPCLDHGLSIGTNGAAAKAALNE